MNSRSPRRCVVELNGIEQQTQEIRQLARDLLQHGERCAMVGLVEQASTILAQVWAITQEYELDYADAAAWEAGWLQMQMRSYDQAAMWFGRVVAFPATESRLWPAAKQTLVQLCLDLATSSIDRELPITRAPIQSAASPRAQAPAMLPRLSVINLGRFQIARAETVLPICTKYKAITLFRYLLSRRHRTARKEELLDLFWPDTHPQAATHSLQVAITTLRRYL